MKTLSYKSSPLGEYMQQFIYFKQMQGCNYSQEDHCLHKLDDFLVSINYSECLLTTDILNSYITHINDFKPSYQNSCLTVVKVFSKYLNSIFPSSSILNGHYTSSNLVRFYLYSKGEICDLMHAADQICSRKILMGPCIHVLIGILACTGLRVGEALALTLSDLDLENQRLFVRKGKFSKDRYVPLHKSVVAHLEQWLDLRGSRSTAYKKSHLFVITRTNTPLKYAQVFGLFKQWRVDQNLTEYPQPRIHDLRHSYACNCLKKWQLSEVDINSMLPILATAMGHVNFANTQIYLHITSAQLEKAAGTFHNYYFNQEDES